VVGCEGGDRLREQDPVGAREGGAAQDAGDLRGGGLERRLGGLQLAQDAGVSRRRRPFFSSSSTPASRSSAASCWETAGAV
jgi:hypothetical protein